MGMSTHVIGFKPPDEKWQRMKAAWDACQAADVEVPREVDDYFGGETPDPAGVEVEEDRLEECGALADWSDKYRTGFEIDVTKLPKDITRLRFFNSW